MAEDWKSDPNSGLYRTEPTETHRTKKMQKPIVLYAATPEHPAQTQLITEDVIAGWWVLTRQSGAMPKPEKQRLQDRIDKLIQAIKQDLAALPTAMPDEPCADHAVTGVSEEADVPEVAENEMPARRQRVHRHLAQHRPADQDWFK